MNTDVSIYHFLNGLAGHVPLADHFFAFIAQYALELYACLFVLAWFALPKRELKGRHTLLVAGVAGIVALLINVVIANIWYRPRPFVTLPEGSFTQLIPHAADSSFPSDHTSGSFAFAFGVAGRSQKWISWSFSILAVLVMVSRVYCGVHYPTDVLASVVVGSLASWLTWRCSKWLFPITQWACRLFRFGGVTKTRESQ